MEYVPGIKINRIKALDQLGVDRKRYMFIDVMSYSSHHLPDINSL